ncbi:hypothetical protein ACN47E_008874 [Coniothyrium glycines]
MDPTDAHASGDPKSSALAPSKPPASDVKPRLTKDQHDVLEHHFQQQHKPSTNTKKDFAAKLGVPLDKINNWFQNRRAKVKQDRKKQVNQYQMTMGMSSYGHPHMPVMSGQFMSQQDQQFPQMHMPAPDFYPLNADISPISHPVQNLDGPSVLDLSAQVSLQQQQQQQQSYDMQHTLRSIPEANRTTGYHPNPSAMMHTIMAATNGAYMHNSSMAASSHDAGFPYDHTGLSNAFSDDLSFAVPATTTADAAPSHPDFTGFADFSIDYSALGSAPNNNLTPTNTQQSTTSISSAPSPFSGDPANGTHQSPNGLPASIASVTSLYTGWTEDPSQLAQNKQEEETEDAFVAPYNLPQGSASEQTFSWGQSSTNQGYPQANFYQQSNASAHAVLSSPGDHSRKFSTTPSDFDLSNTFHGDGFARRNSSTSNLANNMDAINIRNGTPDEFKQPNQPTSIAARRQKRPVALNSNAMRSASYSAALPSPGAHGDHTLRRIRSTGIPNAAGRVQKSQPSSAQRSPMTMTFSDAAASPKFARTFSSSSATTIGQGGSLCPPTPLTPQDFGGNIWQCGTVIRPHSVMPEHNSPESMHTNWSSDPAGNVLAKSGSPPSTSLDLQARLINDAMYRDTPPQSAPATQQSFPHTNFMQRPQMRSGFHSTTDLTIQHPKPSHFRRPSLPDTAQDQPEDQSGQYFSSGNVNFDDFKDISLDGIHHNVPFAPPSNMVPQFLVHEYSPPQASDESGNSVRRAGEPHARSYVFANQGPGDFRGP